MAKQYTINIVNGTGTENILNDTYTVTTNTPGYDNSSILPSSVTVVEGTNEYSFTVGATGTLTLHVTESGTSDGTPVVGATFYRTDSTGTTYGSAVTTDASGNALFENVPFAATGAPVIYYKQTTSDDSHSFDSTVKSITLTEQTGTVEVANPIPDLRTINYYDSNYENLPVDGQITLG